MAKQLGRAMLLKMDISNVKTTIATINSKSVTINNSPIDVTTPDATSPGGILWQQSMSGMKSFSVSADGIFADSTVEQTLASKALGSDPTEDFDIVIPDLGTYSGNFRIESFELGGETEGAVTFSISLTSNGAVTFA